MKRILFASFSLSMAAFAQPADWAVRLIDAYAITPNVTYSTQINYESKLDVYRPRQASSPAPTLVYIHGGGWVGGSKETAFFQAMPYLAKGWAVVNVEYRLGRHSLAPAAVEDCLCALRWVVRNAKTYGFDTNRIVVTGHSAGGHLSLTTGMFGETDLDRQCPGNEPLKVAAIVNWFGITDVPDLLEGAHRQTYAVAWLGSMPDRTAVARRVSPLFHIGKATPPIITIHGDADTVVPYQHGVRLHEALAKAGVKNKLITVPGGKHGGFPPQENARAYSEIFAFLEEAGIK